MTLLDSPNHESRLEAIERAEIERERTRYDETYQVSRRVSDFVEDKKLKKSGGIEEIESSDN